MTFSRFATGSAVDRLRRQDDQAGMTLIELLVSLTAGLVVFGAIVSLMLMTIRQTRRVTSHVEANQQARVTMTKIVKQLNSACFFPQVTPVLEGSTGTKLIFMHQTGEAVAPIPIGTEVELAGNELVQRNGNPLTTSPGGKSWNFSSPVATSNEQLIKGVAPLETSGPVFTYYAYSKGKISTTPLTVPLTKEAAATAVQVNVAFKAVPEPSVSNDANAATAIRDSVLLRLTPPSPDTSSDNPPCQ